MSLVERIAEINTKTRRGVAVPSAVCDACVIAWRESTTGGRRRFSWWCPAHGEGSGRVPAVIAGAPLGTVRRVMLWQVCTNPEKGLVRMREPGSPVQVGHGTYVAKPDRVPPDQPWKPPFEEAAMAYATAAYGDRVPILMGLGAARHWPAIPRAIGEATFGAATHTEV